MSELQRRIRQGGTWVSVAVSVVGVLDAITLVLLLRFWVSPTDLGVATLAVSLFPALDLVAELGLPAALIQQDSHDLNVVSTIFWVNLLLVLALAGLLVLLAPLFGRLHGQPAAGTVLAAYGFKLVLQTTWTVPVALLKKDLRYKELALLRIVANLGDVGGKLAVAAAGHPILCFVAGQICYAVIMAVGVQFLRPFRPRLVLRLREAKGHFRFGGTASAAQILAELYSNADYQVVGRVFGESALGLYRVAYDLVLYCVHFITGITGDIALPTFVSLRRDPEALVRQFLRFSRQALLMTLPVVALILLCADDILAVLFPRCLGAATAARVLCVVGLVRTMGLLFPPLIYGLGRPMAYLTYALCAAIIMPASFMVGAAAFGPALGFVSVAWTWALLYPVLFGLLLAIGLRLIPLGAGAYLASLGITIAVAGVLFVPAMVARWATRDWVPASRLAMVAALLGMAALGLLVHGSPLRVRLFARFSGNVGES